MVTNVMIFVIGCAMAFTAVVDGDIYGCYRPPGSTCSNNTITCNKGYHIYFYNLYYYTKPSTVTCPFLQDEDDCKTSVCCKYGSGDKSTRLNQQDSLSVYKKCSFQQSCSFNSPYSSTTGYDYIRYRFYCLFESAITYITNTTTFTTDTRHLYFSDKLTPASGLTCSCNITGIHWLYTNHVYLSGESCNSVTITVDDNSFSLCTGGYYFRQYAHYGGDRLSIKFTNYTSTTNDVIWMWFSRGLKYKYVRVSCDCSNPVLVDGGWSTWSSTPCSVTCGRGTRKKFRHCNNPTPVNGGNNCIGDITESVTCTQPSCPVKVNGGWSTWSNTRCSVTCGQGTRTRFRHCNNPTPANGGTGCIGKGSGNIDCNLEECPELVNGGWSKWSYTSCSVTCGQGIRTRFRHCNNPTPTNGGAYCEGHVSDAINCNQQKCPGTRVNILPWILFGVCLLVVIVGAIWCIIRLVRRRRGKKSLKPTSDPQNTNNASSTSETGYYVNVATINSLNRNDNDESHYTTLSTRVNGQEGNYTSLAPKKGRNKQPACSILNYENVKISM
ncbi:uncharacterized protein LOC126820417 isoform X1 [Patella vulgata]|uniref:uncharacterized protein LOC126820417 isoform X1 n=2 Tax=Patella vulgata TaxID=6465 RepID=UPI0024A85EDD|nr:uncharacterized protein LOC126820417 isoform X1 [Patella vulgata]